MSKIQNHSPASISSFKNTQKISAQPDKPQAVSKGEAFKDFLLGQLSAHENVNPSAGLPASQIQFSQHAQKRLSERNIVVDSEEYLKLQQAFGKLKNKGGHDSLIVTSQAAYVMDVDKATIVTAVDRGSMEENVFTKIDSTIFIN
jgi:flagellar operon protein